MSRKKYFPDLDDSDVVFQFETDKIPEDNYTKNPIQPVTDSSDDDDAPEDISFASGKQSAWEAAKAEAQTVRQIKQQTKQKRRQIDERFKTQKEEKTKRLDELSKKKLPQDFLDSLADDEDEPAAAATKISIDANKFRSPKPPKRTKFDQDFIPLKEGSESGTQFYVAVLENKQWQKQGIKPREEVANFRTKALTNPRIRREPVSALRTAKEKQRAGGHVLKIKERSGMQI